MLLKYKLLDMVFNNVIIKQNKMSALLLILGDFQQGYIAISMGAYNVYVR